MSTTKKRILRNATGVSELNLPKWDREGNEVKTPLKVKPQAQVVETVTSDINEETISAPTVKELEQIREDAYNEGFEQGYEQGLKQGSTEGKTQGLAEGTEQGRQEGLVKGIEIGQAQALEEGKIATEKSLTVFQSMTDALTAYRQEDELELEQALGALAVRIARQVVQDELTVQPKLISNLVHTAIQALPNPDEKLTVRINPIDYEFVESVSDSHWQIVSDEAISPGGCTVKSGFSYVDYTLEHRFESSVKQLLDHMSVDVDSTQLQTPISTDTLLNDKDPDIKTEPSTEQQQPIVVEQEDNQTFDEPNLDAQDDHQNLQDTSEIEDVADVQVAPSVEEAAVIPDDPTEEDSLEELDTQTPTDLRD